MQANYFRSEKRSVSAILANDPIIYSLDYFGQLSFLYNN